MEDFKISVQKCMPQCNGVSSALPESLAQQKFMQYLANSGLLFWHVLSQNVTLNGLLS